MDADLQSKIDKMYDVIIKLKEKHSQKKIDWLIKISGREFGLVESLVENFLDNTDQINWATKILMILTKLYEYAPDIVYEQYAEWNLLPKAIWKYIKVTSLEDMTPDAFFLLKEFHKEPSFAEILEDDEFVKNLFEALTIINKAYYFDSVCDILVRRFSLYWPDSSAPDGINEQTELLLDLISEHRASQMFIEALIHLLNRKGSVDKNITDFLTVLILNEKTYSKIFSNDKQLMVDILDDEFDKDMSNDHREAMLNLLNTILQVSKENWYEDKIQFIKVRFTYNYHYCNYFIYSW